MATTTHPYEIQEGKATPKAWVGKVIEIVESDNAAEAVGLGHFESEKALLQAAYRARRIDQNGLTSRLIQKAEHADASAESFAAVSTEVNKYRRDELRETQPGGRPKSSGEIKQARAVRDRVNEQTMKIVREGNPKKLRAALDLGYITQEDIDAAQARIRAEAGQTAPAQA
jgi:hypothetical protein